MIWQNFGFLKITLVLKFILAEIKVKTLLHKTLYLLCVTVVFWKPHALSLKSVQIEFSQNTIKFSYVNSDKKANSVPGTFVFKKDRRIKSCKLTTLSEERLPQKSTFNMENTNTQSSMFQTSDITVNKICIFILCRCFPGRIFKLILRMENLRKSSYQ